MRVLIIGNGVAGVTTARLVAEYDPSAEVTLYADERYPYYPRPRLVDFLAGQVQPEGMAFYPDEWYQKRGLRALLSCPVAAINPAEKQIILGDGRAEAYDSLVLAMGARCSVPPIPGRELPGVYTLRSFDDALALRDALTRARRVVILGGGVLGLDTAGALLAHNVAVSIVEIQPRLLPRQLDAEGSALLHTILSDRGIQVITGDSCATIEGPDQVRRIVLKSGRVLETDLVIISAGIIPNTQLAVQAGLPCQRGIVVDERLQTGAPGIYAVGDVAEFRQRIWGIIPAALAQARVVAAQITGRRERLYEDISPEVLWKVMGIEMASIGDIHSSAPNYIEVRQLNAAQQVYKKLVIRDGRVVSAIVLGNKANSRAIGQLIERRIDVSGYLDALLRDEFDLASLTKASVSRD
jgi:nitrite reductase (NADH) large subunit